MWFILTDGAQLDAKWGIDLGPGRDTFYRSTVKPPDAETMGKLTACIPDAIDLYGIPKEEKEEAEWISEFRNNTPGIGMKATMPEETGGQGAFPGMKEMSSSTAAISR